MDSCILLSVYNNKQTEIDSLLGEILRMTPTKEMMLTISDYMKLIAECSPEKYLSYVEQETKNPDSVLWELFANTNADWVLGGGYDYCNLLWSLETLCKLDEYKIRACSVLLCLAKKTFSYKISNTPQETLESLLWLHNTRSALSIEEKVSFIEQTISKYGRTFMPDAIKIIFKSSGFLSDSSLKWRDPELKDEVLTYPAIYQAIDRVVEAILNKIDCADIDIIKQLVDHYYL